MRSLTSVHTITHSSQGQQGSCSVPDVVDPGNADFRSGFILVGKIVVPLASSRPSLTDSEIPV